MVRSSRTLHREFARLEEHRLSTGHVRDFGVSGAVEHHARLDDAACAVGQDDDKTPDDGASGRVGAAREHALGLRTEEDCRERVRHDRPAHPFGLGHREHPSGGKRTGVDPVLREPPVVPLVVLADAAFGHHAAGRMQEIDADHAAPLLERRDCGRAARRPHAKYRDIRNGEDRKLTAERTNDARSVRADAERTVQPLPDLKRLGARGRGACGQRPDVRPRKGLGRCRRADARAERSLDAGKRQLRGKRAFYVGDLAERVQAGNSLWLESAERSGRGIRPCGNLRLAHHPQRRDVERDFAHVRGRRRPCFRLHPLDYCVHVRPVIRSQAEALRERIHGGSV